MIYYNDTKLVTCRLQPFEHAPEDREKLTYVTHRFTVIKIQNAGLHEIIVCSGLSKARETKLKSFKPNSPWKCCS